MAIRYVRLYSDCICWGDSEVAPAKKTFPLDQATFVEGAADRSGQRSIGVACEGETFTFRALYPSDHKMWTRLLQVCAVVVLRYSPACYAWPAGVAYTCLLCTACRLVLIYMA